MPKLGPCLRRFFRLQQVFLINAVAVYSIWWAVGQKVDPLVVLAYSFCLGNLVVAAQDRLAFLYMERKFPYDWLIFLTLLFVLTPLIFVVSTIVLFWLLGHRLSPPIWHYLVTGWKFPSLMTVLFGVGYNVYQQTRHRLERRNRELQQAIELSAAQRELQDQELQRAREIQRALLPKQIPQISGFEIAAAWEPARVIGGDYFDIIRLSDTKLAICIADVVGKSVSAALLMANVQATVRAFISESASPSWLCTRVNGVLCDNIASDKFVTFFFGILDAERQLLYYTNAGHLKPVLLRASSGTEQLENGGAVLGVFPGWSYEDSVLQLYPGDTLLLFTDGITEAAKLDGEEFGEERLISAARSDPNARPSEIKSHLLTEVKQFCNSQLQDDATLIVITVQNPIRERLQQMNASAVATQH